MSVNRKRTKYVFSFFAIFYVLGFFLSSCSQSFTIGVMNSVDGASPAIDGFFLGMENYGYFEGTNVNYIIKETPLETEQLAIQAQALVDAKVDMIFTVTTAATKAAQEAAAGTDIPIVFVAVRDPIGEGLVESLIQPGGNLTGVLASGDPSTVTNRRLELLSIMIPAAEKVWVPYQTGGALELIVDNLAQVATELGVELVLSPVETSDEALELLKNFPEDIDGILYVGGRPFVGITNAFIDNAVEKKVPISVNYCSGARESALMAYCSDFYVSGVQAARIANQIMNNVSPSGIPVEEPDLLLIINLNVAELIDLTVSDDMLVFADEIIR